LAGLLTPGLLLLMLATALFLFLRVMTVLRTCLLGIRHLVNLRGIAPCFSWTAPGRSRVAQQTLPKNIPSGKF
jgi:hypothetical protein